MTAGLQDRSGSARVLCIQAGDDPEGILAALRDESHIVAERADSVERALRERADAPIDLVVLDLAYARPRMSIASLISLLREHRATADAGILAITDEEQRPRALAGLERGADAYLVRPVTKRGLLAQVDALLRIRWAQKQARRLARDWRVAFDAITDAILVLSAEGEIVRCNRAVLHIVGRGRDEVIGRSYREVWPDPAKALPQDLPALGSTTGPLSMEVELGGRWYRLAVDPIAGNGEATGDVVAVLTDISELKRYEHELRNQAEQLRRHNRMQTEFLGLLAHELRNPLGAIAAAASVITDSGVADAQHGEDAKAARQALEIVHRQVGNLGRMVADILDVSRIHEGKIALQRERIDLRACLTAAVAAARAAVEARRHVLEADPGDVPLEAEVDRTRVDQMLANLIDNAIKYTPEGGRIVVSGAPDDSQPGRIRLRVRDDGVGMPPNRLREVFDMFVQYERTLDRAQGGLGLGLTLVKRLAELHGGEVRAHSDGPGRGTTFDVLLPASAASTRAHVEGAQPAATPQAERPTSTEVLLVEDNDDLRELLAWKLVRAGHRVRQARTGREGLEQAQAVPPQVVVLDVGLPELDGYGLARALRAVEATRDCRLIALTGYGSEGDREDARRAGIDAHLVKPVDFEQLLSLIAGGESGDA